MEALHSRLTTGEQSGGQEHCQSESPHRGLQPKSPSQHQQLQQPGSPKPHGAQQQPRQSRRQHPERKRLRPQRQSIDSDTQLEHKHEATKETTVSSLSPGAPPSTASGPNQSKPDTQEGTPKQKRERKPQRPGKYVCTYCGRACAKPSVLQKHIRSHTGERPYPCAPCGFSFKTKSNLYKHRKSHTHRVKAGLALGETRPLEEQITESEDETRQLSSTSSNTERQGGVASIKSHEPDKAKECTGGNDDSYAVKKRLAMRLSRGKHGPQDSADEKASSLILGSKGSTESGYFSRSESTEQSQDSPNTSAKSYAEIILGKYGRLGHLQRMSRHHNQQSSGQEDKNIPFTVPKKQVIDHITKLITINEAVVDTSKIDSVKPRRFSLSRKSSSESQKSSSLKEHLIHSPKPGDLGYKNSGSITMGVPCEKFHHQSLNVEKPSGQTSTAPLLRSHSMPSAPSSYDVSSGGSGKFRLSQSFDEGQPSELQVSRRYGMLRRQPAIEIPLGAELTKEEHESAHSFFTDSITTVPDHKQSQPQPYECEACGIGCQDWEGYKKHKQSVCLAHRPRNEVVISQMECSQLINHAARPGALAMRKRRKEESFEFDDPASPSLPSPGLLSGQSKVESNIAYECPRRPTLQTCSVIQHTSSFEKQESLCENQCTEATKHSPPHEEYQHVPQTQPQQTTKLTTRKLVRQHSVQVPEILVTEDSNMSTEILTEPTSTVKQLEKSDEFQWPQRSSSLAQLPIEKLPPKKKRLRLAEAAQSSGESSFDSISLPRSPSQDSSASYASSRSTSFEESNRLDIETATSTPLRRSRAPQMLTVPGVHQHREMRRSASEQAPHDPQPNVLMAETRSKSFDYSCLSPERTAIGWRERRKCLLMRHSAVRDPDEEEEEQPASSSCCPEQVSSSPQTSSSSVYCSKPPSSPLCGETVLRNPLTSKCKEMFSPWKLQNINLTGSTELPLSHVPTDDPLKEGALELTSQEPPPYSTQGLSGAARAHYLPMSTGLKLEIPSRHSNHSEVRVSQSHIQNTVPHISSSVELLRPVTSPAIAVRLQADTLPPACAIYTTLSQSTSPRPQEAFDAVSHNILTAEYGNYRSVSPDLHAWSDDDLRLSGSGGNKRMLSPSNSIELSPESQQQQKRVKEEEEREVECVDKVSVDSCRQELKQETQLCLPSVCSSVSHVGPSFPSLLSGTCNSWCYLNYIKPNPSTLDEQKPSVYSSWSTSGYDPNPPGLSSKTALSLLHCKQRLSPSIYTTSPMSVRTDESKEEENIKRPSSTEVYSSQSYYRDHDGARSGQQSLDNNRSNKAEEKEEEKKKEEEEEEEEEKVEVHSRIRSKHPPEIWMSEEGSNEKYGMVHSGRGGKCQCEDKSTSMLQKDTRLSAEPPPYKCRHCNVAFKANESITEHMTSKTVTEETCCYQDDTHKGVCESCSSPPDKLKDPQYHHLAKGGHDEGDNRKDKGGRPDEEKGPTTAQSFQVTSSDSEKLCTPGGPLMEPEHSLPIALPPKDSNQKSSASARRALFARRRLEPSASTPCGSSPNSPSAQFPSPQREQSPPRSQSPTLCQSSGPLSPLSSYSCHVSTSPMRPVSPVRCLSPIIVQSPGVGSFGPPGSLANTSAQYQDCPHPKDLPSTARLSVHEVGLTHIGPHPTRPRGAHNLLSHLPLHSQHPSRAPSLLIPIGGIHMIQPRSPLRLYSPTGTRMLWRAEGRFSPQQRQDIHIKSSPSIPASPPDPDDARETSGSSCSVALPHRKGHKPQSPRQPQSLGTEVRPSPPKVSTDVPQRCVYPESSQGQKKAPSSQTQL